MHSVKLIRITTIPLSLEKLLEGQLRFMNDYFEVTAISSEKQRLKKYGEREGVATFFLPLTRKITPIKDIVSVFKLYKFLVKEQPSIVHTHTPKAGIVGMMAAFFARVPLRLHTVAGLPLMEAKGVKRKVLTLVEKLTYLFATHVYPNSKGLNDIILSKNFTSSKKLKIIANGSTNGIDTTHFSKSHFSEVDLSNKKEELKILDDDFVFVFIGRIVKDKGINELVEAFVKLQQENNKCSLLLVGPFEDDLNPISEITRKYISENEKIITTGYQEKIRVFFALSNALVFPSYREGFPNVVMQAGAMGLPSIVTNINGCNEIIEDHNNGLIIPLKNKERLYESMKVLINDTSLSTHLSSNSRQIIEDRYKQSDVWMAILNEYKTLLKNL